MRCAGRTNLLYTFRGNAVRTADRLALTAMCKPEFPYLIGPVIGKLGTGHTEGKRMPDLLEPLDQQRRFSRMIRARMAAAGADRDIAERDAAAGLRRYRGNP